MNRPTFGLVVEEDGGRAGHGGAVHLAVGALQQVRRRRRNPLHQRRSLPLRLSNFPENVERLLLVLILASPNNNAHASSSILGPIYI